MAKSEESKAAKKEKLKAEAAKLGISYDELKKQKKDKKAAKAAKKAAASPPASPAPVTKEKPKRKASDASESASNQNAKRIRTRSMDAADCETLAKEGVTKKTQMTPDEWRKDNQITIKSSTQPYTVPDPILNWESCPFDPRLNRALTSAGFPAPTTIQSQSWPIITSPRDIISIAKTGSGKTVAFLLPCYDKILKESLQKDRNRRGPIVLVMAPTRELACQIMDESRKFGKFCGLRSTCLYGGAPKYPQIQALSQGVECAIATPGRLNDLIEMGKAHLESVKFVVLDEADRMLDMGFEPQIRSIMAKVTAPHQTLLFSATWPKEIQALANDFLQEPVQVNVGEVNALNANKDIKQEVMMIQEGEKPDSLAKILKGILESGGKEKHEKTIVFTAKKISCDGLANQLWEQGFAVDCLHGDRTQWERTKVMNAFKRGDLRMLIATDVAARGLDVKDVEIVINYDMPGGVNGVEDYVHRIGRTGRAGKKGKAYTFFTRGDSKNAGKLVEVLKKAEQEIPAELQAMVRPARGGWGGGRGGGRGRGGNRFGGGGRGRGYMGGGGGGGRGGGGRGGRGGGRGRW
ncbi:hypothetical protein TrVE_jg13815 [Triparma verrucosa]|uniref:RNA helicase n=1 Tax=Triparma verrucosa TaxID=1606542 RepID=A0A9W7C685_9STRA|nr:hypothetical protein TrVE_jg13815 [Triparma verrucosa]